MVAKIKTRQQIPAKAEKINRESTSAPRSFVWEKLNKSELKPASQADSMRFELRCTGHLLARSGGRYGIGHLRKLESIAVGSNTAKNEETAVGHNDVAVPKQPIVHDRFRSDTLGFGGIGRPSFDAACLGGSGSAARDRRHQQGHREHELYSAHQFPADRRPSIAPEALPPQSRVFYQSYCSTPTPLGHHSGAFVGRSPVRETAIYAGERGIGRN